MTQPIPPQQPDQTPTFMSQSGPLLPPQPQRLVPPPVKGERMSLKRWWETASKNARMGLLAAFFVPICACCSLGVVAANGGNHTTTPTQIAQATDTATSVPTSVPTSTPLPTATAIPTATPKPTATPDPNAGYMDYANIVTADATILSGDLSTLGSDCGSGDPSSCRSGAVTFSNDIHTFQADLDAHPAPPCFKTVDNNLRTALQLYDHGAQSVITGIDTNDPSLVSAGATDFNQANSYIKLATDGITNAHC